MFIFRRGDNLELMGLKCGNDHVLSLWMPRVGLRRRSVSAPEFGKNNHGESVVSDGLRGYAANLPHRRSVELEFMLHHRY